MSNLSQTRRRDAHEVMAEIFNISPGRTEDPLHDAWRTNNRTRTSDFKTLMFTFDDLKGLDSGSEQDPHAPHRQD